MSKLSFEPKIVFYCAAFAKEKGISSIEGINLNGGVLLARDEYEEDKIQLSIYEYHKNIDGESVSMHIYIDKEVAMHMQKYLEAFLQLTR